MKCDFWYRITHANEKKMNPNQQQPQYAVHFFGSHAFICINCERIYMKWPALVCHSLVRTHLFYTERQSTGLFMITKMVMCCSTANVLNYLNDTFVLFNKIFTSGFSLSLSLFLLWFVNFFILICVQINRCVCVRVLRRRLFLPPILIMNSIDHFYHLNEME